MIEQYSLLETGTVTRAKVFAEGRISGPRQRLTLGKGPFTEGRALGKAWALGDVG